MPGKIATSVATRVVTTQTRLSRSERRWVRTSRSTQSRKTARTAMEMSLELDGDEVARHAASSGAGRRVGRSTSASETLTR